MIDFLAVGIGVGLAVSLLFSEVFGLAAGGMVVPGYIAVSLDRPLDVSLTLLTAFLCFLIVRTMSSVMIIYGRRRTVITILVAYVLQMFLSWSVLASLESVEHAAISEMSVIGYIVPGLIAIWIDRQGVVETLSTLVIASVAVRLLMIIALAPELVT